MHKCWIDKSDAERVESEIKAVHPRADIRTEMHPTHDDLFRVTLTLRDPSAGNTVVRTAEAGTDGAEMLADARDELSGRGKKTRREIRRERAPT